MTRTHPIRTPRRSIADVLADRWLRIAHWRAAWNTFESQAIHRRWRHACLNAAIACEEPAQTRPARWTGPMRAHDRRVRWPV